MKWILKLVSNLFGKISGGRCGFTITTKEEKFFVTCFQPGERYRYEENFIKSYKVHDEPNTPSFIELDNNVYIFPPSYYILREKKGRLAISGKVFKSGHRVYFRAELSERLRAIEPILSTNELYPNNSICGFMLNCDTEKYILYFGYNQWSKQNKATVLKCNNSDVAVYTFDLQADTFDFIDNKTDKLTC